MYLIDEHVSLRAKEMTKISVFPLYYKATEAAKRQRR